MTFCIDFPSAGFTRFTSTGAQFSRLVLRDFFMDNAPEKTLMVINSIKQITVMETTVVLILLANCLSTKLFTPR